MLSLYFLGILHEVSILKYSYLLFSCRLEKGEDIVLNLNNFCLGEVKTITLYLLDRSKTVPSLNKESLKEISTVRMSEKKIPPILGYALLRPGNSVIVHPSIEYLELELIQNAK